MIEYCDICELKCNDKNNCCITGIFHGVNIEDPLTDSIGVYIFELENSWRYIGSSIYIRRRLLEHYRRVDKLISLCDGLCITNISIYRTDNEINARFLERRMINVLKPKLNKQWNTGHKICRSIMKYYDTRFVARNFSGC